MLEVSGEARLIFPEFIDLNAGVDAGVRSKAVGEAAGLIVPARLLERDTELNSPVTVLLGVEIDLSGDDDHVASLAAAYGVCRVVQASQACTLH